jgi:hypothetical protein
MEIFHIFIFHIYIRRMIRIWQKVCIVLVMLKHMVPGNHQTTWPKYLVVFNPAVYLVIGEKNIAVKLKAGQKLSTQDPLNWHVLMRVRRSLIFSDMNA